MESMFQNAIAFARGIGSWRGVAASTPQNNMFRNASAFLDKFSCKNIYSGPAQTCVTPLTDATFYNAISSCLRRNDKIGACSQAEYGEIPYWDVSRVTNMRGAFSNYEQFNADISNWDVSKALQILDICFTTRRPSIKTLGCGTLQTSRTWKACFHSRKTLM